MPRTTAVECPGCPSIRVLTTDELGLVKVVEGRGKASIPKVVDRWGQPDTTGHVLLASLADHISDPLLAIARKNDLVELLNPLYGDTLTTDKVSDVFPCSQSAQNDHLAALHLFQSKRSDSRSNTMLMCTENGNACLRSITVNDGPGNSSDAQTLKSWNASKAGKVLCSSLHGLENHVLFAGKGIEVNLWDLENSEKIWIAKSPPSNNLGIFTPTWFTSATFLCKDDHRKIAAGTNDHQVRLYDTSAQRRPVLSVDFRESPIKAITEDPNGYKIYIGTGRGDLASLDTRTGKLLGCFIGKGSGSIRSIARHPEIPVVVSCGLDRYVRFWDTETRQLLSAVFLKQIVTNVVIDSKFSVEENADNCTDKLVETTSIDQLSEVGHLGERVGKNASVRKKVKRSKSARKIGSDIQSSETIDDDFHAAKRSSSHVKISSRKNKQKRRKRLHAEEDDDE